MCGSRGAGHRNLNRRLVHGTSSTPLIIVMLLCDPYGVQAERRVQHIEDTYHRQDANLKRKAWWRQAGEPLNSIRQF